MAKNLQSKKRILREKRKKRVRAKVKGTASLPRLSVYRSLKHIYVQIIDDEQGITLASTSDVELLKNRKSKKSVQDGKKAVAKEIGKVVAEKALAKKIKRVVFDRGGLAYHGRVKALAEGAKEGGLKF